MPRSSPNTEDELLEVDLELQFGASEPGTLPPHTFRLRPIHLVVLVPALAIALSLVPRIDEIQPVLVPVDTLPEPVVATTAALMPAESQASLTSLTFEMVPIDLGRAGSLVGPAILNNQIWLIASGDQASSRSLLFSSGDDGVTWEEMGEISSASETVRIHDLESFGGSLVALGTTSGKTGPATAYGYADQVVVWRSSDGSRWSQNTIRSGDGRTWHPWLDLVTDGRTILISGRESGATGSLFEDVVPDYLVPALSEGRLDVVVDSGPGQLRVVAPPGIELFRSDVVFTVPEDVRSVLYRSDDLQQWEEVEVEPNLVLPEMVVKPGGGFVVPATTGDMYSAMDGRGWGRNLTIPPATYRRWGDWLVGLQSQGGVDRLVIGAGTEYSTIDHPDGSPVIWSTEGDITGGPPGLISLVPSYIGPAPRISVPTGSYVFTLADGEFSISAEGPSEATVFFQQLPGSYDPARDTISIDLGDDREPVAIDLDDLQGLRDGLGGAWETRVFLSTDALRWSQSSITFPTTDVEVLGALSDGFLVAVGNGPARFSELYRTGALPSGVTR